MRESVARISCAHSLASLPRFLKKREMKREVEVRS
jgi:hypothetical protein